MNIDFQLYNYQILLTVNKSREYQERVHLRTKTLVNFLLNNHLLVNINPYNENGEIKSDLILYSSNVTDDGLALFKKAVQNWYKAHDRGTPIEKITILEKGLNKIRENKNEDN